MYMHIFPLDVRNVRCPSFDQRDQFKVKLQVNMKFAWSMS